VYRYQVRDIKEFTHQLLLSPRRLRMEQLAGVEKLLGLIKPESSYPYDWVCFHITGYRRPNTVKGVEKGTIAGRKLIPDLVTLAEEVSRKSNLRSQELGQDYQSQEDISRSLRVSTKTIRRWRARGLLGLRVVFSDGVNRLVFCKASVQRFVGQHPDLVRRGAAFNQLSPEEKSTLVDRARQLLVGKRMKLHAMAKLLAEETGRAVETVRYTLRAYDRAHAAEALFDPDGHPMLSSRHRSVWQRHEEGRSEPEIAAGLGLAVESVGAIIREMRARQLVEQPVQFVDHELFSSPDADRLILEAPSPAASEAHEKARIPTDLPAYLRSLYAVALLTREQEQDIFRRYNYLKYKMSRLAAQIDVYSVTECELEAIAKLDDQARALKNQIVAANLRLVVSIAKKHVGRGASFFETVSDGNISLMRAVENFDFSRGFKFSTYASWAIMKNFARSIPEEQYHCTRFATGQEEVLETSPDTREPVTRPSAMDDQRVRDLIATGLSELDERERTVVAQHFGLFGQGSGKTLEELGQRFGVTKERIRQIEARAMSKLRDILAPKAADLLAG